MLLINSILLVILNFCIGYLTFTWVWGLEVKSWFAFWTMVIVQMVFNIITHDFGKVIEKINKN